MAGAGLELSLCTPLANGSRAMRASTTFTGSAEAVVVRRGRLWVVAAAAGGAGTDGVVWRMRP